MYRTANFSDLKGTSLGVAVLKGIPVDDQFQLVPVGEWILHERFGWIVEALVEWRKKNANSFFSRVEHSPASMRKYLWEKSILEPDRILFLLVQEKDSCPVGHLGLSHAVSGYGAELDNVMRGVQDLTPDLMKKATTRLLEWGTLNVPGQKFWLRVRGDNDRALRLYRSVGFAVSQPVNSDYQDVAQFEELSMHLEIRGRNASTPIKNLGCRDE